MKRFKATYTPKIVVDGEQTDGEPRPAMVLDFGFDRDNYDYVIFVDSDDALKVDDLAHFSNCEVWD